MSLRKNNYYLLSLGCSKNTVDSESIGQVLAQNGMRGVENPNRAEVLIVNTCGFIDTAKQESINALRELVEGKRDGQMVIAAGCLSQRYGSNLVQEVPGLDGVIGTRRWMDIFDLVGRLRDRKHPEADAVLIAQSSSPVGHLCHVGSFSATHGKSSPLPQNRHRAMPCWLGCDLYRLGPWRQERDTVRKNKWQWRPKCRPPTWILIALS